ncbi:DsbA family protein [Rhodohalobacter mucosus]|uniref:DSBA-like thioredoxin domain-containing protein n=1 Tax=Rhodohalobacter mucosus TaxID=2079485 RepID=A0A316TZ69_9BACT|nr:DsbA family protein [Rhodohalobacter mucosus]PWN08262.1 hypothetical protein DDZ15_01110 [Rhodohalobacter mucosus]
MSPKPTLIYAYDPLCGWCFGFHPVMEKLAERFTDDLQVRVIPGGLAVDDNAQPIREGYSYISGALEQVEKTTGVSFGKNFRLLAEEGSYLYDSMPSCIAQNTINLLNPSLSLRFAGLMQHALFVEGRDLNDPDTFLELIVENRLDVDKNAFLNHFQSREMHNRTRELFEWCREAGAAAFPTLLLELGEETGLISRGYRPYDTIESHLHHLVLNYNKLAQ